jgi:hypothetical protein
VLGLPRLKDSIGTAVSSCIAGENPELEVLVEQTLFSDPFASLCELATSFEADIAIFVTTSDMAFSFGVSAM